MDGVLNYGLREFSQLSQPELNYLKALLDWLENVLIHVARLKRGPLRSAHEKLSLFYFCGN